MFAKYIPIPVRRAWNNAKTPLFLTFACLVVGLCLFALTMFAGLVPGALWFQTAPYYWHVWTGVSVLASLVGCLAVLDLYFNAQPCYCY